MRGVAAGTPKLSALGTDWWVIGSTDLVDARDNTGTNPVDGLGVPIYDLAGIRIADDYSDLWDGSLNSPISFTESGSRPRFTMVFTGTWPDGTKDNRGLPGDEVERWLDSATGISNIGNSNLADSGGDWISWTGTFTSVDHNFYALSGVLTVPGPSTLALLPIGLAGLTLVRAKRHRKIRN